MTPSALTWTEYLGKLPEPYADGTPQNHADMLRDHADPKADISQLDLAALFAADLIEKQAAEIRAARALIQHVSTWRHGGGEPGYDAAGALIGAFDEYEEAVTR